VAPRLDTVDVRLLRVFVAVVEARGFTAAQTVLNVGASTISNHISALETRLGVKLCRRGRAGFRLTEDGEAIFAETQKLFAAIDGFDLKVGALRSRVRGSLSVGLVDSTISDPSAPLHEAIGRFARSMQDVQLSLQVRPPNELLRELIEGRLHIAVGSFPKVLLGLTYIRLYDETHRFYCGQSHPLFELPERQISLDLIKRQALVSRGYWGTRDMKHLRSERNSAAVNSMEAEARLILSGAYLGYLPTHYAETWVARGAMKALLPDELTYVAPFEIAFGTALHALKPAKLFMECVLDTFGVAHP
jgi:DNA-binding transcriptional LysR family regulator